ncbi:hypothetical protein Halar_0877 [halophilic archaeon DL31]|nr:hypothetical protein Halar_0877 [halophilic archaeon DL31]
MGMGTVLRPSALLRYTMAATNHSVGIAHVTVIPTNAATVAEEADDAGAGDEA